MSEKLKYNPIDDKIEGLEDIPRSEFEDICARCECIVIKENDSGWHGFVETPDGKRESRKICKKCHEKPIVFGKVQ